MLDGPLAVNHPDINHLDGGEPSPLAVNDSVRCNPKAQKAPRGCVVSKSSRVGGGTPVGGVTSSGSGAFAPMTPLQFVEKWKPVTLNERSAAQSHFCDLCRLLDHPDPVQADPTGDWFTFEKGVAKSGGGDGFADVWKRDFFAWEYKKRKRNLDDALGQLARYALALENPPLHIACDTDRFRIVTAWTNTVPRSFDLTLDDLLIPQKLEIIRSAFFHPNTLKPGETRADLTQAAADKFSSISARLQARGYAPDEVAHFVSRLVFLFFAEDVKLLPGNYFRRVLREMSTKPAECTELLDGLFAVLRKGGRFGVDRLPHVNGGLFDDRPALTLDESDIGLLIAAGSENWSHIDPSIFGTLFERLLDPDKRSQIGAHYTDATKIALILEPVIFRPLREEWDRAKEKIADLISKARAKGPRAKEWVQAEERRSIFLERLRKVSVLDAACGSGNFLYLALQGVKNLEHSSNQECEALGLRPRLPTVGPEIIRGIEINPLAAELARTTIWIGDIQWSIQNGFYGRPEPILRPLETIECRNALITNPAGRKAAESVWPVAEFIVGNPPFLGIRLMRNGLGDKTVEELFEVYEGRVSREADFVCYWFEKARDAIRTARTKRVGLVATNSIRGGANRKILDRIAGESRIFEAWSNEPWVIEGAAVRVSLICFGAGNDSVRLDGNPVDAINADLTSGAMNLTLARRLVDNIDVAFMGDTKGGTFDIRGELARKWLLSSVNPNGKSNSDVLRPWRNGMDVTRRPSDMWIVDFGCEMSERGASLFEGPFAYIVEHIKPTRVQNRRESYARSWWRHVEPRPAMLAALSPLKRYILTARVAKYRIFVWADSRVLADSATIAIARDDDVTFGILHSRFHELWSLRLGTSLEDRPRYTPTTTFETFPFPEGLVPNIKVEDRAKSPHAIAINRAAKRLDELRNNWLNPPDLVRIEPEVVAGYPDRILPKNATAEVALADRTLTNLYNQRPRWLLDAHGDIDAAVAAAYGWPVDISDEEVLAKLLELNLAREAIPESNTIRPNAKRKSRRLTPEEARMSPQFKLPITGGRKKDVQQPLPIEEPFLARPQPSKGRGRKKSA
jgi:type II restriction/modification system DNA methylase subunit YeeA